MDNTPMEFPNHFRHGYVEFFSLYSSPLHLSYFRNGLRALEWSSSSFSWNSACLSRIRIIRISTILFELNSKPDFPRYYFD